MRAVAGSRLVLAEQYSEIPTVQSVRTSPAVLAKNPVLATVPQTRLVPRPAGTPNYPQLSTAIYTNVNASLAGTTSPSSAMSVRSVAGQHGPVQFSRQPVTGLPDARGEHVLIAPAGPGRPSGHSHTVSRSGPNTLSQASLPGPHRCGPNVLAYFSSRVRFSAGCPR